ncbi:uncharacterized protein LOC126265282 [Aethina tumida]|uniref:uncharacterized protein LOC126265282 n=1 Tax=Aethina tumida TaxID=116153 RepID=UPI002148EA6F|nr:uncharacterized protein LOC126265282 [Aethina tumida]
MLWVQSYRNPHEKQPWNEPLTICSSLKIPSSMVRMLHTDKKISFSRRARYVIRKYVSADDSSVSYDRKDLIRCVKRCDRLIPIKSESMFYVDSFKEFVLYGFIDDNLMEHYLINDNSNGSYVVKPKTRLMKYLILEAKRLKKYGLARRVYVKNNVPKYYALIPCTDENVPYFIMTRLPYFQDIRQEFKEKDPKDVIKVEITDEVKNFLKQMEIENNFTLSPCMMMSEVLLKFANVYLSKEKKDVDYSTVDLPNSVECDVTIQKLLNSLPSFHRKKEKETDQ